MLSELQTEFNTDYPLYKTEIVFGYDIDTFKAKTTLTNKHIIISLNEIGFEYTNRTNKRMLSIYLVDTLTEEIILDFVDYLKNYNIINTMIVEPCKSGQYGVFLVNIEVE